MTIEVNILTQPTIQASIKTFVASSEDYQNGYSDGYDKGKSVGEEVGAKAEYDRFWDAYQQNGNRTNYSYAFYGEWYDSIFKPKYPFIVTNGTGMFMYSEVQHVPELDLTNCTATNSMFYRSKVEKIEKIKMSENTVIHTAMFSFCYYLTNLTIEGTMAQNINLSSADLEHDSIISVLNALKNYSESGTTYTCTLGTKNLPKLTDAEKAIATQKGWTLA